MHAYLICMYNNISCIFNMHEARNPRPCGLNVSLHIQQNKFFLYRTNNTYCMVTMGSSYVRWSHSMIPSKYQFNCTATAVSLYTIFLVSELIVMQFVFRYVPQVKKQVEVVVLCNVSVIMSDAIGQIYVKVMGTMKLIQ